MITLEEENKIKVRMHMARESIGNISDAIQDIIHKFDLGDDGK
jgi:hypothetical protein